MKKLWKKESRRADALYIDVHATYPSTTRFDEMYKKDVENYKHKFLDRAMAPIKDDTLSIEFRTIGNKLFKDSKWNEAMEWYNQSLRFATEGSENICLGFANRSACFFHLAKYDQCMTDINLAIQHNYPAQLTHKLEERLAHCLQQMSLVDPDDSDTMLLSKTTKLSFPANKNYAGLADVLDIRYNEKFGRHIVANSDIDVDKIVSLEEGFVSISDANDRTLCFNCNWPLQNFIPCDKCVDVMFCDQECMNANKIHKIGCGTRFNTLPGLRMAMQTALAGIYMFDTVDDLMTFVETELSTPKSKWPKCIRDAKSKYQMFLNSNVVHRDMDDMTLMALQYVMYKVFMNMPTVGPRFDTLRKQRFLMHFVWQHAVNSYNALGQKLPSNSGFIQVMATAHSLFNHSCYPNVHKFVGGNKVGCITIRPIKKGQQVFMNYIDWNLQTAERQKILNTNFNFTCKCSRCVPISKPIDSKRMREDPVFLQFLPQARSGAAVASRITEKQRAIRKAKCLEFLRKFGDSPSTNEIDIIMMILMFSLEGEYKSKFGDI